MKYLVISFALFFVHVCCCQSALVLPDTSVSKVHRLSAGLSVAFHNGLNWQGIDFNSVLLATDVDCYSLKSKVKSSHINNLKFEMGFTYFADSIWFKHSDRLNTQYIIKSGTQKFSQSASAILTTHFLNSYEYRFNTTTGSTERFQTESIFNPTAFEIGYGTGYAFLKQSLVNVSLATARLRIIPGMESNLAEPGIPVSRLGTGNLYFDYGFSVQYYIVETIAGSLEINSTGKMFIKAFHRDELEMDVTNRFSLRIAKYIKLRADVKLVYAPAVSYRLQIRNELLVGFLYESQY